MEEIKVGDYIRTENGEIRKIVNIDKTEQTENNPVEILWCCLDKPITIFKESSKDTIYAIEKSSAEKLKHSKILSEIVEVGDYINGKLIHKIDKGSNYCYLYYGNCKTFVSYQIKTILTKELYEENCYKVGGEDEL